MLDYPSRVKRRTLIFREGNQLEHKAISSSKLPPATAPYSPAVVAGEFVFLSGQIPISAETKRLVPPPFGDQVRAILSNINTLLEEAGSSLEKVVKVTVYLRNLDDYNRLNQVWQEFFKGDYPARTCVAVNDLPRDVPLEIDCVAVK